MGNQEAVSETQASAPDGGDAIAKLADEGWVTRERPDGPLDQDGPEAQRILKSGAEHRRASAWEDISTEPAGEKSTVMATDA